jgi:hypothetical protein
VKLFVPAHACSGLCFRTEHCYEVKKEEQAICIGGEMDSKYDFYLSNILEFFTKEQTNMIVSRLFYIKPHDVLYKTVIFAAKIQERIMYELISNH